MKIGKLEINKKLFIIFVVVVILFVTVLIINKIYENRYEKYKIDSDKEYIYTYKTYNNSNTAIPYINIDTDFVRSLNKGIKQLGEKYKDSDTSNYSMTYSYDVKNTIVSLVLTFKEIDSNNQLKFSYVTYVFDLNQGGKALTDDEILKKYNLTKDDVNEEITLQMVKKYDDEINKKILPETCDFKECFQKLRKVDNYTDNAHYYMENGWLVVYSTYDVYSEYKEEKYYSRDDFRFYITNLKK